MAKQDRFYIGMLDENASLQTNLEPFGIADKAFTDLTNAYVWRGRVKKRFGARLMEGTTAQITGLEQIQSRLKLVIGTTNNMGALSETVPGDVFQGTQAFSIGNDFFTVYQDGTPAAMYSTGSGSGTYNTSDGAVVFTGAPASTVAYFYPGTPVMGIVTYEQPGVNNELTIAFDTQFAYQYLANGWVRLGTAIWTGSDSNFFWGYTSRGTSAADYYLYVTNYNAGTNLDDSDPMYYYDPGSSDWVSFTPGFTSGTATNTILTARIIVSFKGRLVLLNVVENTGDSPGTNTVYSNRARWSWVGDPTNSAAFYDNVAGSGSFEDAPTKESIVTAQFIKDRLIVYFESSTWELVFTGNQVDPFVWQKINTELGAESTFSQVPFDKVVIGIGNVGVHACNGSNVERIDEKIPDYVFDIHNDTGGDNGLARIAGIRDYYAEMVYWNFPDYYQSSVYPYNNKVMVYNYKTGSWAFNDDSITAFGYFREQISEGESWQEADDEWQDADYTWTTPSLQSNFRSVIAGNQQGYTFIIDTNESSNCPALQITDIITSTSTIICFYHNLRPGDYVKVENCVGMTGLNGTIIQVDTITANYFTTTTTLVGTYAGAGTLTRVTPIDFKTKQYNFYAEEDRNAYVSKVDCLVTSTANGQCTVDFLVSSSDTGIVNQLANQQVLPGTSILETSPYALSSYEAQQDRLWHPVYLWGDGEYIQLHFYLNQTQATTPSIAEAFFELHAMNIYATPTSSRLQ